MGISDFAARSGVVPWRPVRRDDVDGKDADGLTDEQRVELAALAELPDDQVDITDLPEVPAWSLARRADLSRPVKERAPGGRGYQTDINCALREHVGRISRGETVSVS